MIQITPMTAACVAPETEALLQKVKSLTGRKNLKSLRFPLWDAKRRKLTGGRAATEGLS